MKVILQYIVVIALCRRVDLYVGLSRQIVETRFRQVQAANGVIPYVLLWWLLFSYAGDEIECLKGVPCPWLYSLGGRVTIGVLSQVGTYLSYRITTGL